MFDVFKAIILGIIEGITEWLPISSTGHLILAQELEFLKLQGVRSNFNDMFDVVIQLGAIMAVVVLFWNKLWPFTLRDSSSVQKIVGKVGIKKNSFNLWLKIAVACIPCVVLGLPLEEFFFDPISEDPSKRFLLAVIVSIALIVYGIAFIIIENINKHKEPKITNLMSLDYKTALFIGLFQALAMIPGTSRSGATILGAIILGLSRSAASEFSFFLAVPVMFGASALKLLKFGFDFTGTEFIVLVAGMLTAFIVSVIVIKFLLSFIRRNSFKSFGYYRIVLGIVVLIYFALTR